jgi:outer membrane protein TolC
VYQTGFDAAWELDLFGGIRRNVEAANATIQAAQAGLHDAQVSLTAEVALNYVQLRGFQQQIVIAQQNLQAQQHTADLTRQRLQAGFVSRLDVANAEAQVATTRAQIPGLETSARQAIYALSVLLARPPG